jgi:hypothetical protein
MSNLFKYLINIDKVNLKSNIMEKCHIYINFCNQ